MIETSGFSVILEIRLHVSGSINDAFEVAVSNGGI